MNMIIKNPTLLAATAHLLQSATPLRTKDAGDPLELLARKFGDHVSEVLTKLGATNDVLAGVKADLFEMQQKSARRGDPDSYRTSIGSKFVNSDQFKHFSENAGSGRGSATLSVKATITSATTNAAGSAGAGVVATRDPNMVALPQRRLTVRDLLPSVEVSSNSVEVMRQKARNLNAGMVAEAAAKPESDLQMELAQVPIRTIAHWMKASRQILDDFPQLEGFIDNELIYGLSLKEEDQLLNGDGTGQNLLGLIPSATAYSAPFVVADATMIDNLGLAILQNALALFPADGIVVNSADWMRMRLLKNTDGEYILGDPAKDVAKVLFGVPVVDTPAMTVDKFLVGAFQVAATVYDRWHARVEAGFVNDDFTRNLVTLLGEERIGLAVKRPLALTYGDFGNVA
jgi:HK97 family phage major capsid protein